MGRLKTRPSRDHGDVASFFDVWASRCSEQHPDPDALLAARLALLRESLDPSPPTTSPLAGSWPTWPARPGSNA